MTHGAVTLGPPCSLSPEPDVTLRPSKNIKITSQTMSERLVCRSALWLQALGSSLDRSGSAAHEASESLKLFVPEDNL